MAVVRVYVPVGRRSLAHLAEAGVLEAAPERPVAAYAVTPELSAGAPAADVEDLEYAAFCDAVRAAAAARDLPGDRRVVLAADADPGQLLPGAARPAGGGGVAGGADRQATASRVSLVGPLRLERVASCHVDEEPHGSGPPGAEDGPLPLELLWYDVTELAEVRRLLS
ncbi:MAG TPA: hypothetical protein VFJ94_15880 [Intrasporangium sp.]|uniref:DUF6912 family protein n=1 Tax=Intrasporangium sp. TaxID=1925024 RepID=UPI002D79860F|nr:hypothetical protein [Intrasporangium sp.]HET7399995.1 hypothetical protein [Intrasporangium sp.]